MRPVPVIAAPSDLGLKPTGVTELPRALRNVGMLRNLPDIEDAVAIGVSAYQPVRDSTTGILNPAGIRAVSQSLAGHVEHSLDSKRFPLVLGAIAAFSSASCWLSSAAAATGCFFWTAIATSTRQSQSPTAK